jgi:uncharacterized protein (DUF2141 family)
MMKAAQTAHPTTRNNLVALGLTLAFSGALAAADIEVRVTGITAPLGQVGCALFNSATGFPMDDAAAEVIWQTADANGVVCYTDLPKGEYAVSVSHDRNANKKTDTNFLGIPTEQWGVSNNVRPSLRAPRFNEAAFKVDGDTPTLIIDIKVKK